MSLASLSSYNLAFSWYFKSLWIQRINAGVRSEGLTYSKFINGLSKTGIKIDRKILAEIAYDNPEAFKTIVKKAQAALN